MIQRSRQRAVETCCSDCERREGALQWFGGSNGAASLKIKGGGPVAKTSTNVNRALDHDTATVGNECPFLYAGSLKPFSRTACYCCRLSSGRTAGFLLRARPTTPT